MTLRTGSFTPRTRKAPVVILRSSRSRSARCERDEHDLPVRVPLLELGEGVADLFEWIGRGDWDLDLSRRDELCHLRQHVGRGSVPTSVGFGSELVCLLTRDDGLDAVSRDAEIDRELHVLRAEEVDEGVDTVRRGIPKTLVESVAVGDRSDAMRGEP